MALEESDVERYLCHVWMNRSRRAAWLRGFERLGASSLVQAAYDDVYASTRFDGGKIAKFFSAWRRAGLRPTEVDFAFFVDRSAHMSISEADILSSLRATHPDPGSTLEPWEARRAVALGDVPGNPDQSASRRGRDVTFYVDGAPRSRLSQDELSDWKASGRRRASNVGLSDTNPAPDFEPGPPIDWKPDLLATLTAAEQTCPAAVLNLPPLV